MNLAKIEEEYSEVGEILINRAVLALVFFIVLLASLAEIIFEGFSLKPILLFIATCIIIAFLWRIPQKKD